MTPFQIVITIAYIGGIGLLLTAGYRLIRRFARPEETATLAQTSERGKAESTGDKGGGDTTALAHEVIETELTSDKRLENASARHVPSGETLTGYEIHLGRSEGPDCARPFAELSNRKDGAISANGLVEGTYLHGIFSSDDFRAAWLAGLGGSSADGFAYDAMIDATLDALGAHMEAHVNLDLLLEIASSRNTHSTQREAS